MDRKTRILLIDDEPAVLDLVVRQLAEECPDIEAVPIGDSAALQQAIEAGDFDLVISDYQLGWSDGLTILREVKARYPACPVIMFTGTGDEEVAVQAMKNGLYDYILKPKHVIRLPASVRSALKQREERLAKAQAEEALRLSAMRFRSLIENAADIIAVLRPDGTIGYVSPSLERVLGYKPSDLIGRVAFDYVHPDDRRAAMDVFARALQHPKTPHMAEARFLGQHGAWHHLEVTGTLIEHQPGGTGVVLNARDITARKEAEDRIRRAAEEARALLNGSIQAVARMSELRDPYTAGHQRAVAGLACAIAREMGLPEERIERLRVAGFLHDVGKIAVPAEILAKPGRLTAHEFGIVQTHVRAGHDILRQIAFPEPIAQTVLQHHERLDGSGYPEGLSGEAIIPEARVLAVADVTEAMASHRPYRPARGIEDTLEQITSEKSGRLDATAVDACVRLFRVKGLTLQRPPADTG